MTSITIRANMYAAAMEFASTDATRYYLQGVCIERAQGDNKGVLLIATDGAVMGVVNDAAGGCEGDWPDLPSVILMLSKEGLKACKSQGSESYRTIQIDVNPFRVDIVARYVDSRGCATNPADCDIVFTDHGATLIDGVFPDWRKVIPNENSMQNTPCNIAPKQLMRFDKAARLLLEYGPRVVVELSTCKGCEDHSPMHVRVNAANEFYGVIMPTRAAPPVTYRPKWLSANGYKKTG